ncbi:hypothetical protein FRC05_001267 [Tulasnella sp. 425]|nr:hypothetical protein FRC05_001267 [Tulasnella sp. 425]
MADELGITRVPITIRDNTYYQHPTHWYPDGNIVYLIEDTAIKVHQSIMGRRSTSLREMWDVTSEPALGGFVTIPLEDSLSEFSFLLDVIMPHTCASPRISPERGWSTLIGLIQVAQKYNVDDVATRAVQVLDDVLPTVQNPDRNTSVYDDPDAVVQVINFARRSRSPQFLRPAFYALATQEWTNYPHPSSPLIRLSDQEDLMRVQQGRMRLQSAVIEMAIGRWENCNGYRAYKTCPQGGACWGGYGDRAWPKADDAMRWRNLL